MARNNTDNHDIPQVQPPEDTAEKTEAAIVELSNTLWLDTVSDDEVLERVKALTAELVKRIALASEGDIEEELGSRTDASLIRKVVMYAPERNITVLASLSVEYESSDKDIEAAEAAEDAFYEGTQSVVAMLDAAANDNHCTSTITAHFITGLPSEVSFGGEPDYVGMPEDAYKGQFVVTKVSPHSYYKDEINGQTALTAYLAGDSSYTSDLESGEGIASGLKGSVNPGDIETMHIWLQGAAEWHPASDPLRKQLGVAGAKAADLSSNSEN